MDTTSCINISFIVIVTLTYEIQPKLHDKKNVDTQYSFTQGCIMFISNYIYLNIKAYL